MKRRQKSQNQRRCDDGKRGWSDVIAVFEDGMELQAEECRQPVGGGKGREAVSYQEFLERTQP